jgi:hypothetical protein
VRTGEAVAGQDVPAGQHTRQHRDGPGGQHHAGEDDRLGGQGGGPPRHGGERYPDHAAAVLAGHHQHGQHGDGRLAEQDPGEAEPGGVLAARGRALHHRGRQNARPDGQRDRGEQQPPGARHRAQLGPLRVQGLPQARGFRAQRRFHASLRRSRNMAIASAAAPQAHSTANPAHGASG